ncbi:hypothetical protein TrST_g1792 [Triparma strigata]|uniref:START domain-containing protein n=1 Tax=Triparma strigata TaxID=1606541 RepID=A0A9W7EW30_9STRA|nr:hypothetical protein TrST_g1792 [Triparma strigata]
MSYETDNKSNLKLKIDAAASKPTERTENPYFKSSEFQEELVDVIKERDALKKENETLRAELTSLRANSDSNTPTQTFRTARRFSNFQPAKSEGMTFRERVKVKNEVATSIEVHSDVNTVRDAILSESRNVSSSGAMRQAVLHTSEDGSYRVSLWEMRDGTKIYEFLLQLKEERDFDGNFSGRIEVESITDDDLETLLQTAEDFSASRSNFSTSLNVVRVKVSSGLISLTPLHYGQCTLTVSGELAIGARWKPSIEHNENESGADNHFEFSTMLKSTLRGSVKGLGLDSDDDDDDDRASIKLSTSSGLGGGILSSPSAMVKPMTSLISSSSAKQKYTRFGSVTDAVKSFKKIGVMFSKKFFNPVKVDRARHEQFIRDIPSSLPSPHSVSKEFLSSYDELSLGKKFKRFHVNPGDKNLLDMGYEISYHSLKNPYIRATALIHCSSEQLLSYIMCFDSFERTTNFRKYNGELAERYNYKIDEDKEVPGSLEKKTTRDEMWVYSVKMPSPLSNRKFESWVTWNEFPSTDPRLKSYRIGWRPCEEYIELTHEIPKHLRREENMTFRTTTFHHHHMLKSQVVRASSKGFYNIEAVTPSVCKLTLLTKDDLGTTVNTVGVSIEARHRREMSECEFRFKRNGKEVDRDLQTWLKQAMAPSSTLSVLHPVTEEQRKTIDRCRELANRHKWNEIQSPAKRVKMSVDDMSQGGTTKGSGRGVAILDCTAEEAAAWYYDYCSIERNRTGFEWGQPARFCFHEGPRERHFANITSFPFPLSNREAHFKQIWERADEKTVDVALESLPDDEVVDFGFSMKTVRARTVGLLRDKEVDEAERRAYAALIEKYVGEGKYSKEEEAMLERANSFRSRVTNSPTYKDLPVDAFVVAKSVHFDNESLVVGSAYSVIDGSLENVVACEYLKTSRDRFKIHKSKGGIDLHSRRINDHSQYYVQTRDLKVPGLTVREWRTKVVWKKIEEGTVMIVYENTDDLDEELGRKNTLGTAMTVFTMKKLAPMGNIPQTLVSMVTRVDVAGAVPSFIMNRLSKGFTRNIIRLREDFDQSKEYDRENRAVFVKAIKSIANMPRLQGVDAAEKSFKGAWRAIPHSEQERIKSFAMVETHVHVPSEGGMCWGKSEGEVPSTLEETAAFFWLFDSRAYIKMCGDEGRKITSTKSAFKKRILKHKTIASSTKVKVKHSKRIFYNEMTFSWIDNKTIIIVSEPIDVDDELIRQQNSPKAKGQVIVAGQRRMSISQKIKSSFVGDNNLYVKGREKTAIRLTRVGERRTKVEFVTELECGSSLGGKQVRIVLEKSLSELAEIQIYFQLEKGLSHMDIDNGRILGHAMMWKKPKVNKISLMLRILHGSEAMRELMKQYDWMPLFFSELRKGKLGLNSSVNTKLVCVGDKDAKQIGRNMIPALKSRKTAEAGILQWRRQNPSMDELLKERPWLESLLVVVGRGVVKAAAWGLLWRVSIGAILSLLDLTTDIYVGWEFFSRQRWVFGGLTVGTIGLSMFLQLLVVFFQNSKKGFGRLLKESFFVVSGLKTPVDAYRVAVGADKEEDVMFDPLMEMMYTKSIELFAESIPGCCIQIVGYLASPEKLPMALASIFVTVYLNEKKGYTDTDVLWKLSILGLTLTLILWTIFLRTIKPEYINTFFSLESSWKSNIKMFTTSNDDAVKITIFKCHPNQWTSIREEVKTWVLLNWSRWKDDKPEWFTEEVKNNIPSEFKPNEASELLKTFRTERKKGGNVGVVPVGGGEGGRNGINANGTQRTKRTARIKVDRE